ncbi:hypothetical protein SAY87_027675 [Trapa incisa]|uniref:AP2/ERF domain-containing protein n=1 Tax=Trapa incisa TaxID=236973 RepID=A0AAN7PKD4_9MYRT|nr:hypothetical protein SAY87_027675 [Trapa incisa]
MLDLNVEIISHESLSISDEKVIVVAEDGVVVVEEDANAAAKCGAKFEEEEQHSAEILNSSSVINDEESLAVGHDQKFSSVAPAAFVFDVFKNKDGNDHNGTAAQEVATRQLFPVPDGGEAAELRLGPMASASTATRNQWLKLSFAGGGLRESGGPSMTGELIHLQPPKPQPVRSRRGPRSRSSQYRGVTFYRRTGRWESHIWDCGKQVYLGGFDTAYAAARAYDRAALKFRGAGADINSNINDYEEDMKQMGNLTKEEFVQVLRRQGTGFSRSNRKSRAMGLQRAQEVAVDQFNGQEAMADLSQHGSIYECWKASPEADCVGIGGHHLDLNLGMAPSSASNSNSIDAAGNHHTGYMDWQGPSRDIPMRTAVEKKRRMEAKAPSSSNIGWQMEIRGNYGGISGNPSMPFVFTMKAANAASSGFSSYSSYSSAPSSPSTRHLHHFFSAPSPSHSQQIRIMKPSSYPVDASNPPSS